MSAVRTNSGLQGYMSCDTGPVKRGIPRHAVVTAQTPFERVATFLPQSQFYHVVLQYSNLQRFLCRRKNTP